MIKDFIVIEWRTKSVGSSHEQHITIGLEIRHLITRWNEQSRFQN
jgi:hypothetical protein